MGVSAVKVGFDAQVARFEELVFGAISSHRMDDISSVIIGVQDKWRKSNVAKKKEKKEKKGDLCGPEELGMRENQTRMLT